MTRAWLFLAMVLTACGDDPGPDDPPDGDQLIRATLGATASADVRLYAFSVRISEVRVRMSSGPDLRSGPTNIDVLRGGLLFETRTDATPSEIELRFDQPPSGSGVVPGGRAAVFLSCGISGDDDDEEDRLEYRGDSLDTVRLPVSGSAIALRFETGRVLAGLDDDAFEDDSPHVVDDDSNEDIADLLKDRLAASLVVCGTCD